MSESFGGAETQPAVGAPELLADEDERRKRDLLRAALFGGGAEPEAIGRFRLLRRLGAGGMGVVYAARDDQLGRDVAVKLLRTRGGGATERERLLREAQAMAKLSHPNVVTVYEVGLHADRLFVAMEMVRGQTVAAWLRAEKRSVREVIDVLSLAGEGLSAAHAAGLVHRDFKPENVMIGESGAVKVLDFGLARQAAEAAGAEQGARESGARESGARESGARESGVGNSGGGESGAGKSTAGEPAIWRRLTQTGAILGTPAYMAPEQFAGEATDARTDQYAFCVSLYEALYGERPFEGDTLGEIATAVVEGRIKDPPADSRVPVWLRRVVVRGLARDPGERWPSMQDLLSELGKDPAAARRRRARFALGAAAVSVAIAATAFLSRGAAPAVCEGATAEIEQAWGADARAKVRAGLGKAPSPFAADAADRAVKSVDQYAAAWGTMRRDACLSNARGEQSSDLLDLRMACLDKRRAEIVALAAVLAEGAEGTVARAVSAADSLSPLAACADAEWLRAQVKPPSDQGVLASVKAVRASLVEIEADDRAGQYTRGLSRAKGALAEAEKTAYRPVIAEAAYDLGVAEISLGAYDDAVPAMERAYFEALSTGYDEIAAHASRQLFTVLGYHQSKKDASAPWEKSAEAFTSRPGSSPVMRAHFLNTRALVRAEQGSLDAAAADYAEALATYERELGPGHLKVAMLLSNMAQVAYLRGDLEASVRRLERSIAIREAALGPDNPDVIATITNLSLVRIAQGKVDVAIDLLTRALAGQERVFGKDHPKSTFMLNNLGNAYNASGRPEEALGVYRRALSIIEADKAASPIRLALTRQNVGFALLRLGRADEASPLLESALEIRRQALPKDHATTAETMKALAEVRLAQGKMDEALVLARDALAMFERTNGPAHAQVADALNTLARVLLAKKDVEGARASLERALAIRTAKEGQLSDRGDTRLLLAKTLIAGGKAEDRARAAELSGQAIGDYRAGGDGFKKTVSEVEAWAAGAGLVIPGK